MMYLPSSKGCLFPTILFFIVYSSIGYSQSGSIGFRDSEIRVSEGAYVQVPLVRSGGSSGEIEAVVIIRGVTATAGSDFKRGEGDPLDFNVSHKWRDGEVLSHITGELKSIGIQTIADGLAGEGTESFTLDLVSVLPGSFGQIMSTTVIIEDSTEAQNCGSPEVDRFSLWDLSSNKLVKVFSAEDSSFHYEEEGDTPYSYYISNGLALMAVGNDCVDSLMFRLDGQSEPVLAEYKFSVGSERYFLLAGGRDSELAWDISLGGGAVCSSQDRFCMQQEVAATPVAFNGTQGSVFSQNIEITMLDITIVDCPTFVETKEELANEGGRSCQVGYERGNTPGSCYDPVGMTFSFGNAAAEMPYLAPNLGSKFDRIEIPLGEERLLTILEPINRVDSVLPLQNHMGVAIVLKQDKGRIANARSSQNYWDPLEWYSPGSRGQIYYTADELGRDKFEYVVIPPHGFAVADDGQADAYDHCTSNRGVVYIEVIESDSTGGDNDNTEDNTGGPTPGECVDSDGDGWGWNGSASCQVSGPEDEDNDNTEDDNTGGPTPGDCVDSDGDGWGWNGSASCQVSGSGSTGAGSGSTGGGSAGGDGSSGDVCVDLDGDGWGWDGSASCRV